MNACATRPEHIWRHGLKNGLLGTLLLTPPLGCYAGSGIAGLDGDDNAGHGGDDGANQPNSNGACVDTRTYFEEEVLRPILTPSCLACHNPEGQARHTDLVLQRNDYPGYLDANYATVQNVARLEIDGTSLLLLKPSGQVEHEGFQLFDTNSESYAVLEELVERLDAPVQCPNSEDIAAYFEGLVELDPQQTLRKAVFLLASRYPTPQEYDRVRQGGFEALHLVMDEVMQEPAFYERVGEMYNDRLHTNGQRIGNTAAEALDPNRFPDAMWYMDLEPGDPRIEGRNCTNDAIAREPTKLIEHVLREGLPFTEILTADYTLVTPCSARSYGVDLEIFNDPDDSTEWAVHSFDDIPQAGILTTAAFLSRYPSTFTNRNRARAKITYDFFLATDVTRLAARGIDISSITDFNPTLYDPACTNCHVTVDEVAGGFQSHTDEGWYRPPEQGWYQDMVPPGFRGTPIPAEDRERALQWLGERITEDDKFALSVVHTLYKGLTGQDPLLEPLDANHDDYVQQIRAFEAQNHSLKEIATFFANSGYQLREAVKAIIVSPWFRAVSVDGEPDATRAKELAPMGTARLLSPEALQRRISASVGFDWMTRDGDNALLDTYRFFYGGIDSINVTQRLTTLNGVMVNIAERMANEVSCDATAFDFSLLPGDRMLFPYVEPSDVPDSNRGAIERNIQHLHAHLLGESLEIGSPEINRTYELFTAVYRDGQDGLANRPEAYGEALPNTCRSSGGGTEITRDENYTIRSWMAILAYLLGDYKFLHE